MSQEAPIPGEEHAYDYLAKKVTEYQQLIESLDGQTVTGEGLQTLLTEANGYINLLCGSSRDLYEANRYHAFPQVDGTFRIINGREIDTTPGNRE
jgi:hypothetical protein